MSKRHRHEQLPDEPPVPTNPVPGVSLETQVEHMRELRAATNDIATGFRLRDQLMQAWALSNTLSRKDMAVAAGLAKSRVDQLIREITERDMALKRAGAAERAARHSV